MVEYFFIFSILIGGALLLAGRHLFWIFVGAIGFAFGFDAAGVVFFNQGLMIQWAAGFITGTIGVILALIFQRFAVILAGMIAGGVLSVKLLLVAEPDTAEMMVNMVFIVGAIMGGLIINMAFELSLILMSSLIGAMLITYQLPLKYGLRFVFFVAIAISGIVFQLYQDRTRTFRERQHY